MKNCYLITSAIEVDNKNLLKEDQIRSILTTDERLNDTEKTIESILERDPDATIFLVDISKTEFVELKDKFKNITYVHLESLNNKLAHHLRTHQSKSYGESMIILEFLKLYKDQIKNNFDYLIKISGRYYFTNDHLKDLNAENVDKFLFKKPVYWDRSSLYYIPEYFLPSDMYVDEKLGGYYTVAYAIGNTVLDRYETVIFACASLTDNYSKYFYVDVEYLIFKILRSFNLDEYILETDWIIEGRGGQNGKYFRI